jgi:hypothetical protein
MSDLNNNTDLRVEAGSMAPKSKAAQQAFIVDLMTKGLIPPEKGLRYLQMSETNRLYDELQVDSRQAQRENFLMSQGNIVEIHEWDKSDIHLYEHELYMKSQEFEALDQEIQNIFIAHHMMTKQKVQMDLYESQFGQPPANSDTGVSGPDPAGAIGAGIPTG